MADAANEYEVRAPSGPDCPAVLPRVMRKFPGARVAAMNPGGPRSDRSSRKTLRQRVPFPAQAQLIANALTDQHIGLEETDDGLWPIYFSTVLIATLDERDFIIRG